MGGALGAAPVKAEPMIRIDLNYVQLFWMDFCIREPRECRPYQAAADPAEVDERKLFELVAVNEIVNAAVTYRTDKRRYQRIEHFAFPVDGYGDCEDFALEKRRMLRERGWPDSALLLTVVWTKSARPRAHVVLTVRTTEGDFVLDMTGPVTRPELTDYQFYLVQSQANPNFFIDWADFEPTSPCRSEGCAVAAVEMLTSAGMGEDAGK